MNSQGGSSFFSVRRVMRLSSFGVIEKGLVESATSDLFATMINLENVYVSLGRLLGEFLQVFAFRVAPNPIKARNLQSQCIFGRIHHKNCGHVAMLQSAIFFAALLIKTENGRCLHLSTSLLGINVRVKLKGEFQSEIEDPIVLDKVDYATINKMFSSSFFQASACESLASAYQFGKYSNNDPRNSILRYIHLSPIYLNIPGILIRPPPTQSPRNLCRAPGSRYTISIHAIIPMQNMFDSTCRLIVRAFRNYRLPPVLLQGHFTANRINWAAPSKPPIKL
ncbi:hypothetical protein Zmor_005025 [Zophobas morio]|uniref:Uncharacterized protein n=1 Tax=Zophobas morio TaxID=2755281 RepID=A0AA38IMC7_9CUCU|nr:hypothetical protein Zmor_005025 [Zophobas morio]